MSKTFGFFACFLISLLVLTSGAFAVGDWIMEWYVLDPIRDTGGSTDALGIDWFEQMGTTEAEVAVRAVGPDHVYERTIPGEEGSVAYAGGTYTCKSGGADIWGTADAFRYTYKEISGDFTIALKAESIEVTNDWAKLGPMVRQSNAPGSQYIFMLARALDGNKYFQERMDTDGSASGNGGSVADAAGFPVWLKITRSGDNFTGAISPDGAAWTDVGTTTLALTDPVLVGLAVTSHSTGNITTAEATNLTIDGTEPAFGGMTSEDIGIQLTETFEYRWSVQNLGDINDSRNLSNGFYGGVWGDMSNYVCYAMVGVYSPVEQDTVLNLAQDDDAKVWINGEQVIESIGWTGGATSTVPFDVHLVGGKVNAMMVKIGEGSGGDYLNAYFDAENLEFSTEFTTSVSPAGKLSVPWGSVKSLR